MELQFLKLFSSYINNIIEAIKIGIRKIGLSSFYFLSYFISSRRDSSNSKIMAFENFTGT